MKKIGLFTIGVGLLYYLSSRKSPTGTAESGIEFVQQETLNPLSIVKPAAVPITATLPGVAGFNNLMTNEVPPNIFAATQDIVIEGTTDRIANVSAGTLLSSNDLAWISTKAADEAVRQAAIADTQAKQQAEAAFNLSLTPSPSPAPTTAFAADMVSNISEYLAMNNFGGARAYYTTHKHLTTANEVKAYMKAYNTNAVCYSWLQMHWYGDSSGNVYWNDIY